MSKTVDERIVKMEFDNKQFESNVKTSMSTLDRLKQSLKLDGASKSFENINKASNNVSFEKISSGIDALQKRFSTFGIVGMRVIENITDSMMRLGSKSVSFLTEGIIQGGKRRAMNLENAHFQLQGLLKDEEAVAAVMKNVNDSVDGTAYSLDSAAKVASQLAASGMRAGDQMFTSLRAVAGVAAMTNSEYDEIGKIFTTVAGNGRLMGDQLLQLSSRGMNAAATLAEYLGKSEAEVREMVSKGKIDFETFANAMDDAFGEHAKKANETFTGALSNIKAALARIGALFVSPLIEQNGSLVQLFNAIRERINDVKASIAPLANVFVKSVNKVANVLTNFLKNLNIKEPLEKIMSAFESTWDKLEKRLTDAGISVEDFQEKLKEVANEHGISIDDLIEKYGSLGAVMSAGKLSKSLIIDTLKRFIGVEQEASLATDNITDKLETLNKVVNEVITGNLGNGEKRIQALTDAGYDHLTVQKLVNYIWERNGQTWKNCTLTSEDLTKAITNLSTEEIKSIGYTDEQAEKIKELAEEADKAGTPLNELLSNLSEPTGKELIISSLQNALSGLSTTLKTIKDAWKETFSSSSTGFLHSIAETIHTISEKLVLSEDKADKLKRTFKGLFAVLDLIRTVLGGAFSIVIKVVNALLSAFNISILDITAAVGDALVWFRDWIKENNLLGKAINFLVPIIKEIASVIYEWVSAVYEWIKNNETIQNGIQNLISTINSAASAIKNWIHGLRETDNIPQYIISGLVNGLKSGASAVFNAIIDIGKGIIEAIKGVLGIHSPSTEFFEIGKNVIAGLFNGLKSGSSTVLNFIGDLGKQCIEAIKNVFSGIDFGKLFAVGISAGTVYTVLNILDTIKKFAAPAEGIGHMTNSIGGFFDTLSEKIGGKKSKIASISENVLKFAAAIGILSASVYALAQLDYGKLWSAIGAIAVLGGIIAGLTVLLNKIDFSGEGLGKLALTFIGMSVSLYIMASAIKKLEFLNPDNAVTILIGFSAVIIGFISILALVGKLANSAGGENLDKATNMLLKISVALLLMIKVIKLISGFSTEEILKGLTCITLFGLIISGLMAATRLASGKDLSKVGTTILAISVAMLLMVKVIKQLSGLSAVDILKGLTCITLFGGIITGLIAATRLASGKDLSKVGTTIIAVSASMLLMALSMRIVAGLSAEEIIKGMTCILLFGGIITGLIAATKLASKGNLKGVASTLLAMALAIGLLAAISIALSLIDVGSLAKGITAVGILTLFVDGMMLAAKGIEKSKGSIIALAVTVGILAAAVAAFSFIGIDKLAAATIALSSIMGMFALMEKAASSAKGATGSIIVMSLVVVALAGVLYLLSTIPVTSLIPTATALSILLLAMSGSMVILSKVGEVSKKAIGSLALIGLVVGELATILSLMSYFNVSASIETATSLSILLLAISGAMVILSKVGKVSAQSVGALALIGLVVAELATILGLMSYFNVSASIETATALSILLLAMSKALIILGAVGKLGAGAFIGIGALAVLITAMGIITTILGWISNITQGGFESNLDAGIKILEKIGLALGSFFGGIAGGFLAGMSAGLPEIGTNLSAFIESIQPFIEAAKNIDASSMAGIGELAKAILLLTAADLLEGLTSWVTGGSSLSDFAQQLVPFGKSLKAYGETVDGIKSEAIVESAKGAEALAKVAESIPSDGGLWQSIAGNKNLANFGQTLIPFGISLVLYSTVVQGVNSEAIESSATAASALVELANNLPALDGLLQGIIGSQNLATFGETLIPFGEGLKEYAETVDGINNEAIVASATAASALVELANNLPALDGILQGIIGSQNLATFGETLIPFGSSLKEYAETVDGINNEAIVASATATSSLVDVVNKLPSLDGLLQLIIGSKNIAKFGDQLIPFGKGIKAYAEAVDGVQTEQIVQSKKAVEALVDVVNVIQNSGSIFEIFTGSKNFGDFGTQLEAFGKGISTYSKSIVGLNATEITKSKEAVEAIAEIIKKYSDKTKGIDSSNIDKATGIVDSIKKVVAIVTTLKDGTEYTGKLSGLADALTDFYSKIDSITIGKIDDIVSEISSIKDIDVSSIGKSLADSVSSGIEASSLKDPAINLMKKFIDGLESMKNSAISKVKGIVTAAKAGLRSYYGGFQDAGKYLVQGFANGISLNSYIASQAARKMASAAKTAANNELGVESPSKEFYKIGNYVVQGFSNAISDKTVLAENASSGMAAATIEAAKKTLQIASPARAFIALGNYIGDGLAVGIQMSSHNAVNAIEGMSQKLIDIAKLSFEDAKKWIEDAKYYDELSLEEEFYIWEQIASRYQDGTEECAEANKELYRVSKELNQKRIDDAEEAYKKQFQHSKDWIDQEKNYNRLSLQEEYDAWKRIQAQYAEGTEERKEADLEVYKLRHELIEGNIKLLEQEINDQKYVLSTLEEGSTEYVNTLKEINNLEEELSEAKFQHSKDWIDQEKNYNRLSLQEEYDAWKRIQSQYAEGTEERKEADLEVYKLRHELIEGDITLIDEEINKQKELLNTLKEGSIEYGNALKEIHNLESKRGDARYNHSMDWIQNEEDFDRLGLVGKLAAYRRVRQDSNLTAEQRKNIDKTIYNLEKDIYTQEKQFYKDVDDIQKDANEKRLEYEKEFAEKKKEINDKLNDDIQKLDDDYANALESRTNSLYSSYNLFDKVTKKKKVSGSKLMKNLQSQIDEFNDWDDTLNQLSARGLNEALIGELQDMGPSAIAEIKALNSMSDSELAQYADLWATKHEEAKDRATSELEDLRIETQSKIKDLKITASNDIDDLDKEYHQLFDDLERETKEGLSNLESEFKKSIGLIPEYTEEEFNEMVSNATAILREANWQENGEYIVDGLTTGIESKRDSFIKSITDMMTAGIEASMKVIDANSPSKEFAKIGGYIDQGLVVGIEKYRSRVVDATSDLGYDAIDSMEYVLNDIADAVNADMDLCPTIRPVIDMSDINRGTDSINGIFTSKRSMGLIANISIGNQNSLSSRIDGAFSRIADNNVQSTNRITEAIEGLKSDFADLVDRVSNLQMVVDSGALVGAITPKMDRSLGNAAIINRRVNR